MRSRSRAATAAPEARRGAGHRPRPVLAVFAGFAVLAVLALLGAACGRGDPEAVEVGPPPVSPAVTSLYFQAAFGDRHGPAPTTLRRWTGPVRIGVHGETTAADRGHLRVMARRLGELTAPLPVLLDDEGPGIELRFVPADELPGPRGLGGFRLEAGTGGEIVRCEALLPAGEAVPQYMRLNLALEALVGCLGLAGTAPRPYESVFFAGPNWYEEGLTPLDREVIRLHHAPDLVPGMNRDEVRAALHARLDAAR